MTTTLPTLERTIDNAFLTTWYSIRKEAIDNILSATPLWVLLRNAGCMTPQTGGDLITRTLSYDYQTASEVRSGDTLPMGEQEVETMAVWRFKSIASHVQRSVFDDVKNTGPDKIKDLVGLKLRSARDGLEQQLESSLHTAFQSTETARPVQGINDLIPPYASKTSGTYGGLARPASFVTDGTLTSRDEYVEVGSGANAWWGPKYLDVATEDPADAEAALLEAMRTLFNSCHNNQSPPNVIVSSRNLFELYEDYAMDQMQIIKVNAGAIGMLADLGFDALMFKGKPMIWSSDVTTDNMLFLNTDWIEIVYNTAAWFEMTDWKPVPLQEYRIAHILCQFNMISTQLRRHGRLIVGTST
jgi:hypothetical protein